jgi:transposase InsO family protein
MPAPKSRTDGGHEDDAAVPQPSCARPRQHRQQWRASELAALALPGFPADADAFLRWLKKREVPRRIQRVQGGKAFIYRHADLPPDLRLAIDREDAAAMLGVDAESSRSPRTTEATLGDHNGVSQLPQWKQRRAAARMIAVKAFRAWCSAGHWRPGGRAAAVFADAWRSGEIELRFALGDDLNSFAACTLLAWQKTLNDQGEAALAGNYKPAKPKVQRHPELLDLAEAMIVQWPHLSGADLHAAIALRADDLGLKAPSERACQRWLADWKRKNKRDFAFLESPDAHKGKFRPAFGKADEGVTRLNQRWEFDATKADIMLADGLRYTIVAFIDVFSRRAMMRVHRTSSGPAVAALLRAGLIEYGVPEAVHTDNGSDFVSEHVQRVLARLEIEHWRATVGAPEQKPFIERFFKTFSHGLLKLLGGYVGHDVASRQKIESRKSFISRLFDRNSGARPIQASLTAEQLQAFCDDWCAGYHNRPHDGISTTPALKALGWTGAVRRVDDMRALDVLLAPLAGGNGRRTVTKKGIRVENGLFIAPQLGDLVGETVECRQDPADAGRIYVFDDLGRFVCIAEDPDRTGISREEIAEEARRQTKAARSRNISTLKDKRRRELPDPDQLVRDIVARRAASSVITFPKTSERHDSPALQEAGRASRAEEAPVAPERTEADARRNAQLSKLVERRREEDARDPRAERNARVARGLAAWDALNGGAAIPETERAWFEAYETTTEFLSALSLARGVDIRRGHYRPIGQRRALKA